MYFWKVGHVQVTLLNPQVFFYVLSHLGFSARRKIENSDVLTEEKKQMKTKTLFPNLLNITAISFWVNFQKCL